MVVVFFYMFLNYFILNNISNIWDYPNIISMGQIFVDA